MMKYVSTLIILIIVSGKVLSQPAIMLKNDDSYDWGKVKIGITPLKTKINIYNTGNETLRIDTVKMSCGCTTAPLNKKVIPPNDSATLDVSLNVPAIPQQVHKIIDIFSNDPKNKQKTLHLLAEIVSPLKFFPSSIIPMATMLVGKEAIGKIIITNATDHPITIRQIKEDPENLISNLKEGQIIKPDEDFEFIVRVTPKEAGILNGSVQFKTDDPDLNKVSISVRGSIIAEVEGEK